MQSWRNAVEVNLLAGLGKALISLSVKKGKSLEKIAYEAEVSKGYIYDIAKGKANPSLLILSRLAAVLDVSLADFIKSFSR